MSSPPTIRRKEITLAQLVSMIHTMEDQEVKRGDRKDKDYPTSLAHTCFAKQLEASHHSRLCLQIKNQRLEKMKPRISPEKDATHLS
jgi:hypothetical protein